MHYQISLIAGDSGARSSALRRHVIIPVVRVRSFVVHFSGLVLVLAVEVRRVADGRGPHRRGRENADDERHHRGDGHDASDAGGLGLREQRRALLRGYGLQLAHCSELMNESFSPANEKIRFWATSLWLGRV